MYQDTVTLFNRKRSRLGDMWYPTVLHNVNVNTDKAVMVSTYGEQSQNSVIMNVKFTGGGIDEEIVVEDKFFRKPIEWEKTDVDFLGKTISFKSGDDFDFFMIGEWRYINPDVPENDNDYPEGFFQYMKDEYDDVYAITSCSMYSVIPHFEIAGR